jgi:nitronate monooxygenase
MTGVSGPDLVVAACRNGVIGSFPTHNAPSVEDLDGWLGEIHAALTAHGPLIASAPVAPNLVVHPTNKRLLVDLDRLIDHGMELVITSVGSPAPVLGRLHEAGCRVFADVATMRQAEKAIAAGVDGVVLLTAGAGGQTGSANPFAFVRAVRERFDGTIVLAGGIADGVSLFAAEVLGADLAYMGTRFIATREPGLGRLPRRAHIVHIGRCAADRRGRRAARQPAGAVAGQGKSWRAGRRR